MNDSCISYGCQCTELQFVTFRQTFNYDNANRLGYAEERNITINQPAPYPLDWSRNFNYDPYGNMWVTNAAGITPPGNTPAARSDFNPNNNQLSASNYDPAGNQLMADGYQISYDAENRQTSASTGAMVVGTYNYDGEGNRVVRTTNNGTTVYVYDAFNQLAAEYSSSGATRSPCQTCYLSRDHLGTVRVITDENGAGVGRHDYLPFGEEIPSGVPSGAIGRGDPTWAAPDNINQKFTAKERDSESGLDYFGARYYGSALGRFTSPDPKSSDPNIGGSFSADPQSWNAYSYVGNNPLTRTDPDGRDWTVCESDGSNCGTIKNDRDFEKYARSQGWSVGGGNLYDSGGNQIGTASWAPSSDDLGGATAIGRTATIGNALGVGLAVIGTGGAVLEGYGAVAGGGLIGRLGVAAGPIFVGLTPAERQVFEELEAAGNNVQVIPRASGPTADFLVNGVPTELKTLTSAGANTLKNAIQDAAKQGQNIIIDARNVAVNAQNVVQQVQRAQGNAGSLQGRVTVLTKEGPVKY